jgi:predicted metal-binding protein
MVRKIVERVPDEQLQKDLEKYRQRALKLGATDAKIITTDNVVIDERVLAKCTYPKCPGYGTNLNCPPYAMDLDLVRKVVNNFRYAIFAKVDVPSEEIAGPEARDKTLYATWRRKINEIISKIEAEAFSDGYYLALAFGSGPCKSIFCPDNDCSALVPGQPCRHPLKARSSMEGVGMDVFAMATKVGWDIYPIGEATLPSEVPCGLRLALVFIG